MKYIGQTLSRILKKKMLFKFTNRFVILKIYSPFSRGNQQMASKTNGKDSLYLNSERRLLLMQHKYKSKEVLIWISIESKIVYSFISENVFFFLS